MNLTSGLQRALSISIFNLYSSLTLIGYGRSKISLPPLQPTACLHPPRHHAALIRTTASEYHVDEGYNSSSYLRFGADLARETHSYSRLNVTSTKIQLMLLNVCSFGTQYPHGHTCLSVATVSSPPITAVSMMAHLLINS